MVMFYYPNSGEQLGKVTMRFFGQQCRKCSRTKDYYVDPEFEDESIRLILEKLDGWNCYGKKRPARKDKFDNCNNEIQGPHEKTLCEACRFGCCEQNKR